jgi:spore coat protein U-like protein
MMRRIAPWIALAAAVLSPAALAIASTATGSYSISGYVMETSCQLSASSYTAAFPEYLVNSPVSETISSFGIAARCSDIAGLQISVNNGLYSANATATCNGVACTRAMSDGAGHYISYELYSTACCSTYTIWNTTNLVASPSNSTGNGTYVQATLGWAFLPALQNVAAGSYSDTVTASYTF